MAERCDALLVQAPAGTGKTKLQAAVVHAMLEADPDETIICICPTNNASMNLGAAIAGEVPDETSRLLVLQSIQFEKTARQEGYDEDTIPCADYRLHARLSQLETSDLEEEEQKFIEIYIERRQRLGEVGFQEKLAVEKAMILWKLRVVCATLAMAEIHSGPLLKEAAVILVDEAGQIAVSQLLALLSRVNKMKKLLFTGDRYQLPAFKHDLNPNVMAGTLESALVAINEMKPS